MANNTKPSIPAPSDCSSALGSQPAFAEPALRKVDWGGWSRVTALLAGVPAAAIATAVWSPAAVWSQSQTQPALVLTSNGSTNDITVTEGDAGTPGRTEVPLNIRLSPAATENVKISFFLTGLNHFSVGQSGSNLRVGHCAHLETTPDADICLVDRLPDVIKPGESVDWSLYVLGDGRKEDNETFNLEIEAINSDYTRNRNIETASISITITDDDAAPVLGAVEDVTVDLGQAVNVTAAATDGDGDTVSYAWSRKDGETTPVLPTTTALNQAKLTFTPPGRAPTP